MRALIGRWKIWNIGRYVFPGLAAFVNDLPRLFFEDLCRFLLFKVIGEATCDLDEFFGSPTAELYAGELFVELRSVEGRVERSVGLAIDVDVDAFVYMWVALLHIIALLVGGVLDEEEVVVGIACDCSVKIVADGNASRLACEELDVDAWLGVGVDRLVLAIAASEG